MRGHATVIEQAKIAGGNSAQVYKFELASLTVLLDEPTPPRIDELGVPRCSHGGRALTVTGSVWHRPWREAGRADHHPPRLLAVSHEVVGEAPTAAFASSYRK